MLHWREILKITPLFLFKMRISSIKNLWLKLKQYFTSFNLLMLIIFISGILILSATFFIIQNSKLIEKEKIIWYNESFSIMELVDQSVTFENNTVLVERDLLESLWGNQHAFISSVYYVDNIDTEFSKNIIRMNVLADNNLNVSHIYCDLDGNIVKTYLKRVAGPDHLCKWGNYFLDCPAKEKPRKFALIDNSTNVHELEIIETDKTPRTLVVCFSRVFLFEHWQVLLTTLEMYKAYGADLMVVQILSIISELFTILKAYELTGSVRIKEASKVSRFPDLYYDPNAELEWLSLATSYTECLYDYRDSAEFILNVDVDDIVIPRHTNNFKQELINLASQFPMASSFEFMWATTRSFVYSDPKKFSINEIINEAQMIEQVDYGKSVVRPRRIEASFIHWPLPHQILKNYTHVKLTQNDSIVVHFRKFFPIEDKHLYNKTMENYFANNSQHAFLDQKFKSFLNIHPDAKKAFSNLSTEPKYYNSVYNCYIKLAYELGNRTMDYCPNPLVCKFEDTKENPLPPCYILKNEYEYTEMETGLMFSSVVKSGFVPNKNCLL